MKKMLFTACILAAGLSLAALQPKGMSFTVGTAGPDCYADGSPLQIGESYALVWVASGKTFKGFLMNGKLVDNVDNKIIGTDAPLLAVSCPGGARCPYTPIQIAQETLDQLPGGEYLLLALDTRTPAGGVGGLVNGSSVAAADALSGAVKEAPMKFSFGALETKTPVTGGNLYTAAKTDALPPVITGFTIENGKAVITVQPKGTAYYTLTGVKALDAADGQPVCLPQQGDTEPLTFTEDIPEDSRSGFFRVVGGNLEQVKMKASQE